MLAFKCVFVIDSVDVLNRLIRPSSILTSTGEKKRKKERKNLPCEC